MSSPRKSRRVRDAVSLHKCPQCHRTYERPDHLARHLDSHRNERTFQCPTCRRGFNRRDVLQRHRLIHADGKLISKHRSRVIEACMECAFAKVSCDDHRPCNRCQRRAVPCLPRQTRRRLSRPVTAPMFETDVSRAGSGGELGKEIHIPLSIEPPEVEDGLYKNPLALDNGGGDLYSPNASVSSTPPLPGRTSAHYMSANTVEICQEVNEFPAFFEQVMMQSGSSNPNDTPGVQQPRGVFDFMCEPNFTSPDAGLFGSDILMDLDRMLEFNPSPAATTSNSEIASEDLNTKQRVAAFRRSLWLWVPQKNQNGFSEEGQIPLRDGDMTASISSLHRSRLEALDIRGKLTNQLRDHIFQLILRTAGTRLSVPSFPTAESLDTLIKIGISKRTETDAWIHPYTLYLQDSRPELLTALVAAGCVCSAIPSINKTGVLLLEIVRVSLAQLAETDNSVLRDLQYFQASMMWLDIGVFCGYKRKMQITESHLQPLCTSLRRAGAFDRSFYAQSTSPQNMNGHSLESIWYEWIRQESLKRLAYHLYEHDVEAAAAMNRPPLTSYTEYTLPFPNARELWLAPTAAAWKHLWDTKYSHSIPSALSLRELLADPSALKHIPSNIDVGVMNSALLHGQMAQVWEFRQQALLADSCYSATRAVTKLWLQSRQEDLLSSIKAAREGMLRAPAIATLLGEFAMMYLHVNIDSIQRFAGQFGELEARQEYPKLRDWSLTKEARTSIWYAGQVLRAGRQVPPFQLRGFDILAVYQSILVLWVFGLLRCGERQREDAISSPNGHEDPLVILDGLETEPTEAFVNRDNGQPGLTLYVSDHDGKEKSMFCQLRSPRLVMDVGVQVFESNFPGATDNLPPLVDNLRNLIRDLGNLP
ncbi:uncharacterized protein BJX67DRAFT_80745 [Aspergillus lucknowensis]|uniref:Uncharacterized protein n=1 Tax=Aspergillus lucknowensis TaxID=176173 RepID=A0ABR4LT27_9EURO